MSDYISFASSIMDLTRKNGEVISNNIANSNTPDYKAKEINFMNQLRSEMKTELKTTSEFHMNGDDEDRLGKVDVSESTSGRTRVDGNNVDQTKEMVKLLENNNKNGLAVNSLNSELNLFRTAIGR